MGDHVTNLALGRGSFFEQASSEHFLGIADND